MTLGLEAFHFSIVGFERQFDLVLRSVHLALIFDLFADLI